MTYTIGPTRFASGTHDETESEQPSDWFKSVNPIRRIAISGARRCERGLYRVRAGLNLVPNRAPISDEAYDRIATICAFLGPYRNLTTLTASLLSLHPNCRVLNHGGFRILAERQLNIFRNPNRDTFRQFCHYAIDESYGGAGGDDGGSIIHSHSFQNEEIKRAYDNRFPAGKRRDRIESLIWKESLTVTNHLRDRDVDIAAVFAANPKLRFLMPIRHPIDCAKSNFKTGHAKRFRGKRPQSVAEVMESVLLEIADFHAHRLRFPDRYFAFFQFEMDEALLLRLARFLGVAEDPQWLRDAAAACILRNPYAHDPALVSLYRQQVDALFADNPEMASRMLEFVDADEQG